MDFKEIEKELDELEGSILRLKRDYEVYFAGGSKLPPNETQKRVERLIRKFSGAAEMSYALRFRYNMLTARFNTYQDLWNKQMRWKEEGRTPSGGYLIHAEERPTTDSSAARRLPRDSSPDTSLAIYNDYIASRFKTGESGEQLTYESFVKQLSQQKAAIMKKYNCRKVEFYVSTEGKRTKLKAKIVK